MTNARIDIRKDQNSAFVPFFRSRSRDLVCYGGAGAGKSYAVAQKLISKAIKYPNSTILIIRKYRPSLKLTCFKLILELLDKYQMPYRKNLSDLTIELGESTMYFLPIVSTANDDPAERIKSLTDITDIWIEEATELSFDEYQQIKLRLRGEDLEHGYRQRILTFNPIDKNHWIYKHFFEKNIGERQKYTYRDNRFIDKDYKAELEELKEIDETQYQIYTLGDWGTFGNLIYTKYEIEEFDYPLDWYDEILAGVDFGFVHPAAWNFIGLKENHAYIIDELYERKKTNPELIELIQEKQKEHNARPSTFADSAEPDRIEEMNKSGICTYPADKKVQDGISAVKAYHLHIHPRCINTIAEIRGYCRKKDPQGNVLEEPVKANDHTMDDIRYAIYTYRRMLAAPQQQYEEYYEPETISPY